MMNGSQDPGLPDVLHIVGRSHGRENSDICGEYLRGGTVYGRAVYRQRGSTTVIRYWRRAFTGSPCLTRELVCRPPQRRWVIDREGLRESDVCAAFAADSRDLPHPAHPELIWCVWESRMQGHVADTEVIAVSAPRTVTIVGRAAGATDVINGRYDLASVCHGRPAYVHSRGDLCIRYLKEEHRWIIACLGQDNGCVAFAEAGHFQHPGHIELEWMLWEAGRGMFCADPGMRALVAPTVVRMAGRRAEAENARINGSYTLAGIMEGRPAYVQPGTHHLIRYSSRTDRWLLDTDGLVEPSLASRLYYWIFRGDLNAAGERCAAFSEASGSEHPGSSDLDWFVWESRRGNFLLDQGVCCTTAPPSLQVSGRAGWRENEFINGEYALAGTYLGRVYYQKPGTHIVIRFWPPRSCWLIDGLGLQPSDACSAFADCLADSESPADVCSSWLVYEATRGSHLADPCVAVSPSGDDGSAQMDEQMLCSSMCSSQCREEAKDSSSFHSSILHHRGLYGA
ncbi:unnamed protein product [Effrenium voratum]|nr:unnamed protein product [Effrenium voratum]